jgi:tRNA-specific 2-thiouridylase
MMNVEELRDKRIAVLLSGGVDSSVVVYELVRQGLQPDCFYIKIGADEKEEWDCSMEEDMEMATAVAHKYGCPLEVVDCHREYWNQVTAYTMDKVRAGLTPNPDVMCNRLIKFGAFHEKRGHDYDLIATGHYAQTEVTPLTFPQGGKACRDESSSPKGAEGGLKWLCTAPDPVKDQTDFLAQITDWQLQKAIFPIGHYVKDEVRQIAEREHLVSAKRKDSQGICFLGKIDYNEYVRRFLGELPGDVVELETGKKIGTHQGHWFHTIGQRKGLGLGGGPWFVVKKDVAQNILYVSHGYNPETAYKQDFSICDFHSLNGELPPADVTFKIRHTPEFYPARLEPKSYGAYESYETYKPHEPAAAHSSLGYTVHSAVPIHGVAPGQFCVIYDAQHHRCYGSGEICI